MNFTIRQKLYGFGLLGVAFSVGIGFTGWRGILQVSGGIQDVASTSSAIRNHMEASRFLDLSRADLSKMLTATGDDQDTAAGELADHEKLIGDRLATAITLTRSADASAALQQENKMAEDYVAKASKISDLRKTPTAAAPLLGAVLQSYSDMRDLMDKVNDQLQAESKRSQSDADRVVGRSKLTIIIFCGIASLLFFAFAFATTRQISRRLSDIIQNLKYMAAGDLTRQVADTRPDELGEMARWFNDSIEKLRVTMTGVASSAEGVTSSVDQLNSVSQQMSANSEETSSQANVVSSTTQRVTQTLQTVASSTEEMSSSIKEIAKSVGQAAQVAGEAVQMANSTNKTVARLGDSSSEIGNVIKVITSIAEQTNLLALNATIEAARAGDAGKGFAVVANEVKELAKQTAKATEEISRKIEAIQSNTKESVEAIGRISEIIIQINEISRTVSAAVEEQNTTTNDISRNISEGARGSDEIAQNITGVAQAAQSTSLGARDVQKAAEQLREMSSGLKELVCQFKYSAPANLENIARNGSTIASELRPVGAAI